MMHWSKELSLELLHLLASHPAALQTSSERAEERWTAWREIQTRLPCHLPLSELQTRAELLFSQYQKLEARVKASRKARERHSPYDPAPPPEIYTPNWFAFEAVAELLALRSHGKMSSGIETGGETTGKAGAGGGTGETQPPPATTATSSTATFKEQFKLFSKFGDRDSDGKHIKLSQSDKWMRQAKVIDGKKITSTDTGIAFKKLKQPKLTETDYNTFLEDLAKSKGFDVSELKAKMTSCGPPGFTSNVNSGKATGAVERLTDPSKYTGSHKERFDESGKGKGLAGRRDNVDTSGYVSGYGNKNTYNKEHPTN